jgi:hypothetical protein
MITYEKQGMPVDEKRHAAHSRLPRSMHGAPTGRRGSAFPPTSSTSPKKGGVKTLDTTGNCQLRQLSARVFWLGNKVVLPI